MTLRYNQVCEPMSETYEVSDEIALPFLPPGFCVLVCVRGHELEGEARFDIECSAGLDGFDKEHTAVF
jgi:hypothetical protein